MNLEEVLRSHGGARSTVAEGDQVLLNGLGIVAGPPSILLGRVTSTDGNKACVQFEQRFFMTGSSDAFNLTLLGEFPVEFLTLSLEERFRLENEFWESIRSAFGLSSRRE